MLHQPGKFPQGLAGYFQGELYECRPFLLASLLRDESLFVFRVLTTGLGKSYAMWECQFPLNSNPIFPSLLTISNSTSFWSLSRKNFPILETRPMFEDLDFFEIFSTLRDRRYTPRPPPSLHLAFLESGEDAFFVAFFTQLNEEYSHSPISISTTTIKETRALRKAPLSI